MDVKLQLAAKESNSSTPPLNQMTNFYQYDLYHEQPLCYRSVQNQTEIASQTNQYLLSLNYQQVHITSKDLIAENKLPRRIIKTNF